MADAQPPTNGLLKGARVYLSGPMDFVASREEEYRFGWRNRVGSFLKGLGAVVLDPWNKPDVRGLHEYGREGIDTTKVRDLWSFEDSPEGAQRRAACSDEFWETQHIDLRMVDTSDFTIAYCPTNIYSVGTPHEVVLSRQQRKPVLFVSPPVVFPALDQLREHMAGDETGLRLLKDLEQGVPIKPNPRGIPSLWYATLLSGEAFFDGFGFDMYRDEYGWENGPMDQREASHKPVRPLLPFLKALAERIPNKWDARSETYVPNDDWLLWDFSGTAGPGSEAADAYHPDDDDGES